MAILRMSELYSTVPQREIHPQVRLLTALLCGQNDSGVSCR